jgi:hypothetical protein
MPGMTTPCHVWTGACDKDGYGVTSVNRKYVRAHVVGFILENGLPDDGHQVLHHCDNPPCVRGNHLFGGTQLENHQDKARKGRSPVPWAKTHPEQVLRGDAHPSSKLNAEQVQELRRDYIPRKVPLRYFAEKFGVAETTVHWALRGGTWKETVAIHGD